MYSWVKHTPSTGSTSRPGKKRLQTGRSSSRSGAVCKRTANKNHVPLPLSKAVVSRRPGHSTFNRVPAVLRSGSIRCKSTLSLELELPVDEASERDIDVDLHVVRAFSVEAF